MMSMSESTDEVTKADDFAVTQRKPRTRSEVNYEENKDDVQQLHTTPGN